MGTRLCLSVLGELTASYDGVALDLGGRRQHAVLGRLIVARGEVVSAERLIDSVWGDDVPANATGALQSYISHLRRRLEPAASARTRAGIILSAGPGYAVRLAPHAVDAWRFEQLLQDAAAAAPAEAVAGLSEALQLWRGPAYADCTGAAWVEAEAARLTQLRSVARERLLEARLSVGESALLVPELEALVAEEPLREQRWRLLALALYRAHRQADALAALRRARSTLADELGVDPGPALRALEAEVLAQSPSLDVPIQRTAAPRSAPSVVAGERERPLIAEDLVERGREVTALHRAVSAVCAGEPALVLIEGSAGIGKTRLLTEACRLAERQGVRVLSARGSLLERSFGFGSVRQLFEPSLVDPSRREQLLVGAAVSARGVFERLEEQERADGSFAVLHGLYWLTVNLAVTGPLVLAVDDVQWCDSGSLRFLAYLVKRLEGLPVLIVATLRTGVAHEDDALLAELTLDLATVSLRPAPLSPQACDVLVHERLGPAAPSFAAACHRTTSGNPLLLRQLLCALEAQGVRPDAAHTDMVRAVGSRAVSSLVQMRLRRMPRAATTAARAVAVLGGAAQLPAVAALAELTEDDAAAALTALSRAEVLREEQPLAFVHPLVRDAVYHDVPEAERALQHERAARVLQRHGHSAEQVAAHLLLAPRRGDSATVAVLRAAARTAAERGASDGAVTLLRRGLDEPASGPERVDVLLELGLLETLVDGPSGAAHLGEAYAQLDDDQTRGEIAIVIARTHIFASPAGVATAFARQAKAALPADLVDITQGLTALQRIAGFMQGLDPADYRSGPVPEVTGRGHGARMLAATLAHELLLAGEQRQRAVELARFALAEDRLVAVDAGLLWVVAANVCTLADEDLGDFWERARRRAHTTGALFSAMSTNVWFGFTQLRRGELVEALQSFADATEQDRMWGSSGVGEAFTRALSIHAHLDRADVAAARAVADDGAAGPVGGEGSRWLNDAYGRLLIEEGQPGQALAQLQARSLPGGVVNPAWSPWRGLQARALHALGRSDEATPLARQEVELLRGWGAPSPLGASLRLLGELLGPDGTPHLREAEQVLAPTGARLELARARVSLGSALDVGDDEAVPLLRQGLEAAAACGATGVRRRAEQALARRGHDVELPDDGPAPLTGTEGRVLDLTAAGLDVREVAQQLFLTPGTVRATLDTAYERADR